MYAYLQPHLHQTFNLATATADEEDEDEDLSDMEGGEDADASSAKQLSKKHQVSTQFQFVVFSHTTAENGQ